MSSEVNTNFLQDKRLDRIASDILRPVGIDRGFLFWMASLGMLLYILTMIPDMAISRGRIGHLPSWLQKTYELLSFNFQHKPEQYKVLLKAVRILLILIVPTAFAIHTVTSWLFAVTTRPGWDSTIFGPYFISGAAAVIILMFFVRNNYKLNRYITIGTITLAVIIISVLMKLFPVIPIWEVAEEESAHPV